MYALSTYLNKRCKLYTCNDIPLCQLSKHVSVASPVMCFVGEENDIIDFYFRQKIIGKSCIYKKVCVV